MTGNEDNGRVISFGNLPMRLLTVGARQMHIQHQAPWKVWPRKGRIFCGRAKGGSTDAE
jgi:hypothetical protein